MIYIVLAVAILILYFFFNPMARKIRKINELIDKDRSVCDFIMTYVGWNVTPYEKWGLRMAITTSQMINELYITYNGERPTDEKINFLYNELTKETSVVTKAHKANMPVDMYIRKYGFDKK